MRFPRDALGYAPWNRDGRQLFDTKGETIGVIVGAGYERKKFGTEWLVIETVSGRRTLVPADRITRIRRSVSCCRTPRATSIRARCWRAMRLSPRRASGSLRLHWGIGGAGPNSQCMTGCGLCMANKRFEHRRQSE